MSNFVYNRLWVDLLFEGVTQFVMLTALFGFMDWMIICKWLHNWDDDGIYQPPGVIMAMIVMFLGGGKYDQPTKEGIRPFGDLVPMQTELMQICVVVAFMCVPLMLLVKPCYYSRISKVHDDNYENQNKQELRDLININVVEEGHTFGDYFIH